MKTQHCPGCHELLSACICRRESRTVLHAALYGLYLRQLGYDADEAAVLVSRRYPVVQRRLQQLVSREEVKEHAAASAAAGGAA